MRHAPRFKVHGNKGKITGFARPDNWLNKIRKKVKHEKDL